MLTDLQALWRHIGFFVKREMVSKQNWKGKKKCECLELKKTMDHVIRKSRKFEVAAPKL